MSEYVYATDERGGHWLTGEEIVRCRDCVHFTPRGTHRFANGETNEAYCEYIRAYRLRVTPDGFCAWGVRRCE